MKNETQLTYKDAFSEKYEKISKECFNESMQNELLEAAQRLRTTLQLDEMFRNDTDDDDECNRI